MYAATGEAIGTNSTRDGRQTPGQASRTTRPKTTTRKKAAPGSRGDAPVASCHSKQARIFPMTAVSSMQAMIRTDSFRPAVRATVSVGRGSRQSGTASRGPRTAERNLIELITVRRLESVLTVGTDGQVVCPLAVAKFEEEGADVRLKLDETGLGAVHDDIDD